MALADLANPGRAAALLVVVACLGAWTGGALAHGARADRARCFGAVSRDPEHRCVNHALDLVVTPTPAKALLMGLPPCAQIRFDPGVCAFGATRANAAKTVAVIGDSHARHWRPALQVVAARRGWRVLSIVHSGCPLTLAANVGPVCDGWAPSVVRYLAAHPEVATIFVSANAGSQVGPVAGMSAPETMIDGYVRAWNALPSSVREIFVIHDVPTRDHKARRCIVRAVARHHNPGVRCARSRAGALHLDYQAVAGARYGSGRVKVIDLTPFMCSLTKCFPVVGGALVIKDVGHLTSTFSRTLGPYLGRAITRLRAQHS